MNDLDIELDLANPTEVSSLPALQSGGGLSGIEKCEKFVAFFLGTSLYGIPVDRVAEIVHLPVVTPLPNSPRFVSGITSVRGEVVAVLNLKALVNEEPASVASKPKLVVLHALPTETQIAFPVDRMHEIITLDVENALPADTNASKYVSGTAVKDDGVFRIIDTQRLVDELRPGR